MDSSISGQCHCCAVQWTASLPHKVALNCHCNMCRALSGADYSSWVVIPAAQFSVTAGEANLTTYQATERFTKSFCKACGSTVSCVNDDKFPGHIYVAKGNVTSGVELPAQVQVFTQFKANWVHVDERIPVLN